MFWKLEEARLVQVRTSTSAANADVVTLGAPGPPNGKVWIVIGFIYYPSVGETQTVAISKYTAAANEFTILNPVSLALNPAGCTCIEQGMEYFLLPGEYFIVRRGNHTAGSTMTAVCQLIEIDLPLYTYEEPQEVKRQKFALSSIRRQLGGGGGRPGSMVGSAGRGTSGGGRGGAEPV